MYHLSKTYVSTKKAKPIVFKSSNPFTYRIPNFTAHKIEFSNTFNHFTGIFTNE